MGLFMAWVPLPCQMLLAAGGAILFGMSANEIAAAVGAAVAILTFLTNLWYKHQHLRLAKAKAECVKPGFPCPEMPADE